MESSLQEKLEKLRKFKKQDNTFPAVGELSFPLQNQENAIELEESKFEERCEIVGESKMHPRTRPKTMQIIIEVPERDKIEVDVNPLDTVDEVKEEIFYVGAIHVNNQTLRYKNQTLKGSKTLKDYEITPGAVLQLTIRKKHSCFLPNAPVTMGDGSAKIIKNLKTGDIVLSYDPETKQLCPKKVSSVGVYESDCLCEIDVGYQKIICTPNHPFWVPNKGWTAVEPHTGQDLEPLKIGDNLLTFDLKIVNVISIRVMELKNTINVYNLHIESAHNFFAYGVLVHNTQIYLRNMVGKIYKLDVELSDSISEIKNKIQREIKVPVNEQCIIFAGKVLEDNLTLSDYNIKKENTLHLYPYCPNDGLNTFEEKDIAINLNIIHRTTTYLLPSLSVVPVRGLKQQITTLLNSQEDAALLYGGKILVKDDFKLQDYKVMDNSDIIVIPATSGGNCLRFMQVIEDTETKDADFLEASFGFFNNERKNRLKEFLPVAKEIIEANKNRPDYCDLKLTELLAIMLWTSDVLYEDLNETLRNNGDLTKWGIYLKHLMKGLQLMPYYIGKCYRGIRNYQDRKYYQKGNFVDWRSISSLSRDPKEAKEFTNSQGTFFEVETVSARNISGISMIDKEEEVVLMPYSCFEVMDVIEARGEPMIVKLREMPIPRGTKVIFWVDDNPEYIYYHGQELAKQDISCVFCTSTKDALRIISSFRWLLYFDHARFRIVTDMVRYEGERPNWTAGVDLLKQLFQTYNYNFEVLVYCNDVEKAEESCKKANIQGPYKVTKYEDDLLKFITFS